VPELPRDDPCGAPRPDRSARMKVNAHQSLLCQVGGRLIWRVPPPASVHRRFHRQCGYVENFLVANSAFFAFRGALTALSEASTRTSFPLAPSTERN
jgi:hypothetical protein